MSDPHRHRTAVPGMVWPEVLLSETSPLQVLLSSFAELERALPQQISVGQSAQLDVLVRHAARTSSPFRTRLQQAGLDIENGFGLDQLRGLTPMSRRELQAAGDSLFCTAVPPAHLPMAETRTSGSSGVPVVVRRTALNQLFWLACTMREHQWWQRNYAGTLAIIRANLGQERISQGDWGPPASLLLPTGPAHALSMSLDVETQAATLIEINPHYLLTYPNNLAELLRTFERSGNKLPRLLQIRTIGETVSDALRTETRRVLGVEIVDSYSAQEVGIIALQCPHSGQYHVMAENLLVEVLDEQGNPCQPGQTGEVVITDLHNFATPLIRYAIGDYAEVGEPCSCGRTLPVLRRIVGRNRNMVRYPDGTRRWPRVGFHRYREVAPVIQYQLAQRSQTHIEVRLVVERPLTPLEESALAQVIHEALGYPFDLSFVYFPNLIPRSAGGKFDEFVCEVPE